MRPLVHSRLLDEPALVLGIAAAYAAGIASIDYLTNYELRFGVLYLPAVFLATWGAGRAAGIAIGLAFGAVWLATLFIKHPYDAAFPHLWEGGLHLLMYIAFALVIARLKEALELAEQLARQHGEQLQRTARLLVIGEMASTLAHELNQPLGAIANYNSGCIRLLKSWSGSAEGAQPGADATEAAKLLALMEKCNAQALRAGEVVRRIREFVRRPPDLRPQDAHSMLAAGLAAAQTEAPEWEAQIRVELEPQLPQLAADRQMIEKVIVNLARNGLESMRSRESAERTLLVRGVQRERHVEFQFCDRGCGVPAEAEPRLFQPFYTTKAEGLGLGLAICRSIIEYHRGEMWFTRNPEGGSTFHFTLPAAA